MDGADEIDYILLDEERGKARELALRAACKGDLTELRSLQKPPAETVQLLTTFYTLIDDTPVDWVDIKNKLKQINHMIVMNTKGSNQLIDEPTEKQLKALAAHSLNGVSIGTYKKTSCASEAIANYLEKLIEVHTIRGTL